MRRDSGPALLNLAAELQVMIMLELNPGDLARCKRVCTILRNLISSEATIQYKMELDIAGMIDGLSEVPLRVKLQKLRARNAAWNTGFPMHVIMVDVPRSGIVRACAGGFFLYEATPRTDAPSGNLVWRMHRPAWPQLEMSGGLDDISFTLSDWEKRTPGMTHIGSWAVNPEEDMVAFTNGPAVARYEPPQCVVLSLAQNRVPHPLAAQSIFRPPVFPNWNTISSAGDLLAWSIAGLRYTNHPQGTLQVMNWKTGAFVWQYGPRSAGRCLVLDSSHILMVDHRGLFVFDVDPDMSPTVPPTPATDSDCLLHLAFPVLTQDTRIITIQCHESRPQYFSGDCPLFRDDPQLYVLAVHMAIITRCDLGLKHYVLVVPFDTIRTRLDALLSAQSQAEPSSRNVPWEYWGPNGARLLKLAKDPYAISVMGSRVSIPLRRRIQGAWHYYVVDVRPQREEESFGGRQRDVFPALGAPLCAIDASDTIQELEGFAEPVTTRLPFHMAYVCQPWSSMKSRFKAQVLGHDGLMLACTQMD